MISQDASIVGRESELAALQEFFEADRPGGALVLTGGPGIGKTTLWECGAEAARERGMRVLSARPSEAETRLSFAALIDLLDGVDTDELAGVPAPQLLALEVALLRAEPTGGPAAPDAIAAGFLSALRVLASRAPLVVAIDDIQWLDPQSAEVLAFAAAGLGDEPARFILAKRPSDPAALERALERRALRRLDVGPLSLGATRRILAARFELTLSRHVLRRVFDTAHGNPLFALELGRALDERGVPEIGEEIPLPDAVEDLLGTRVARLPAPARKLLLAVALDADMSTSELARLADRATLDDAVGAGVLLVDGDHVRPSHPLLAATALRQSRARERRELHLELATSVADGNLRARHLALATDRPDAELAATLAAAAAGASTRGAAHDAVELAAHALRLTPEQDAERTERVLTLAEYLETAGEAQQVTDLLTPELDSLPPGAARVRAQLLLSEGGGVTCMADHVRHLDQALAETNGDPILEAHVLAAQALNTAATSAERIREAEAWAQEALPAARRAGPDVEQLALSGLGYARALAGQPIDDVCERFNATSETTPPMANSPDCVAAQRLFWRGEVPAARAALTRLLSLADERGEAMSYALQRLNLCEFELRIGAWEAAARLLDEWSESVDPLVPWTYKRCRALLAAGRGFPQEAEEWAGPAIAGAAAIGVPWQRLESLRARGIAALLAHDPGLAAESMRPVWEHTEREGIDEPGAFPVAPDLVEALVALGERDEALAVTSRLRGLAEQQEHPWGLATAKRCEAVVQLAGRYDDEAATALAQAAADYGELGLRFDRSRSLLSLGRAQRRHKKWGAARSSLEQAVAAFEEIGSPGWAEQARSELPRAGARRPPPTGELTATERRVVDLAAAGRSNKEIAHTLFIAVHTVEVHLSNSYEKLGVRSRAQLAGRLAEM